jgi:hypothetical protein
MSENPRLDRYYAAAHAVQSGVMHDMALKRRDGQDLTDTLKHMRTGIDTAKVEQGGLAALLIEKGVFTTEEYEEAMASAMEKEKARYEQHLSERMGTKVTLA